MAHGTFNVPYPINEPVLSYAPGTPEREALQAAYHETATKTPLRSPCTSGRNVTTEDKRPMTLLTNTARCWDISATAPLPT